jgi:glycosyltransferase involved in cell wall biosynthesis
MDRIMLPKSLNIVALTDLYWDGSNYVRLTTPLRALKEGYGVDYIELPVPAWRPWPDASSRSRRREIERCDVVWVSRPMHHATLAVIGEALRLDKPVLVDIDDWLLDVPEGHDSAALLRVRSRQEVLRVALRAADAVTVSTPQIAERCTALGLRTHVLPNAIDCTRFTRQPRAPGPLTVAFCGTGTHRDDMPLIGAPLRRLLQDHADRVRVVSVGCAIPELDGVAGYTHHDYVPSSDYPRFLSDLRIDIGLAPLHDSPFSQAKSDIKYLEYSATGAATIASPVAPYQATIRADRGVIVDENSPAAWSAALQSLVAAPLARQRMADHAYEWVRHTRSIEATASRWYDVFHQYADEATTRGRKGRELAYVERIFTNTLLRQIPNYGRRLLHMR